MKLCLNEVMTKNKMFATGVELLRVIESLGEYSALMVGGTPRDLILNREINDIDIATNCPIEILTEKFQTYNIGRSKDFGIVVIVYNNFDFEVAQFRSESNYSNNRHPEKVQPVGDFYTDSSRRDFTCNSLGLRYDGTIIDHHGGVEDIKFRNLRAVGDPARRFAEDYVRMLRAARFMATLNFVLSAKTRRAIKRLNSLILKASPERVALELIKTASKGGPIFARFIQELSNLRLLSKILPEVDVLRYFHHKLSNHPEGRTVYEHVIKSVAICRGNDPTTLLAVLLHDIGKGVTLTEHKGYPKYKGHDKEGAKMVYNIGERLHLSNNMVEAIAFSTENHMKFHDLIKMKPSKVTRLVSNAHWPVLVEVGRADEFSRGSAFRFAGEFEAQIKRAEKIREDWQNRINSRVLSIISGDTIMRVTGERSGPIIGILKNRIQDRLIDEGLNHECHKTVRHLIMEEYELLRKQNEIG